MSHSALAKLARRGMRVDATVIQTTARGSGFRLWSILGRARPSPCSPSLGILGSRFLLFCWILCSKSESYLLAFTVISRCLALSSDNENLSGGLLDCLARPAFYWSMCGNGIHQPVNATYYPTGSSDTFPSNDEVQQRDCSSGAALHRRWIPRHLPEVAFSPDYLEATDCDNRRKGTSPTAGVRSALMSSRFPQ
jgi:hypothetical protein